MNRFKNYLVLVVSVMFLTGCATTGAKNTIESDCAPNFTVEGSFWTGTTYRSSKEFPKVKKQEAFDKVIFALASDGWQIINSNKEQGLISASQGVIMGRGKTVPLNVVIRQNKNGKNGIRMDVSFFLTGGLATSTDGVLETFCKVYKAVESGTSNKRSQPTAIPPSPPPTATKLESTTSGKSDRIYLSTIKNGNIRAAPNTKSKILATC